ncbi:MAG TPA: ROK family protein [Chloroflexota bacterium]|nr:ROK family protein [Chloroflexota bacterium]
MPSGLSKDKILSDTVSRLLAQLLAALIVAILAVLYKSYDSPILWVSLLAIIAAVSTALAARFYFLSKPFQVRDPDPSEPPESVTTTTAPTRRVTDRSRVFAGIDVGRHQISHGVLRVGNYSGRAALPAADLQILVEDRRDEETHGNRVYDDLIDTIRKLDVARIDGLGVGLPGQVDAPEGRVVGTPAGWGDVLNFKEDLAIRLAADDRSTERFGVSVGATTHERVKALNSKILIDNDVNCAARAILNDHYGESGWRHFSCVYVGRTGVGSGLVLNGEMYYGSDGVAGEVGHITVDLLPAEFERRCECRRDVDSLHFQALVSGDGLLERASNRDPGQYARLVDAAKVDRTLKGDVLRALAAILSDDGRLGGAMRTLAADESVQHYVHHLVQSHARYLAIGLASVMNMLDLDHIVLGGGVIDALWDVTFTTKAGTRGYCDEVVRQVGERTLDVPQQDIFQKISAVNRVHRKTYSWQGAALAFCDASYPSNLTSGSDRQ